MWAGVVGVYLLLGGCRAVGDTIQEVVLPRGVVADHNVGNGKVQLGLVHLSIHHLRKRGGKGQQVTHSLLPLFS